MSLSFLVAWKTRFEAFPRRRPRPCHPSPGHPSPGHPSPVTRSTPRAQREASALRGGGHQRGRAPGPRGVRRDPGGPLGASPRRSPRVSDPSNAHPGPSNDRDLPVLRAQKQRSGRGMAREGEAPRKHNKKANERVMHVYIYILYIYIYYICICIYTCPNARERCCVCVCVRYFLVD